MITKENAKEYLPLVQALAEGKVIELHSSDGWGERICLDTYNDVHRYRIKPEPRRWWLNIYKGAIYVHHSMVEADAGNHGASPEYRRLERVEVVEVLP